MQDRAEIEALYRRHGSSVLRRAKQILKSDADAQEVLQEVFERIWQQPRRFDGRSSFTTWLYSVTTNACLNRLRDDKNRARLLAQELMPREPPTEVPRSEPVTLLRQTLALLQPEAAQAAVYYFLDGMTHEEIAHVMGCSRRHVGDVLDRTIRFLKTQESNDGIQTRTRQA